MKIAGLGPKGTYTGLVMEHVAEEKSADVVYCANEHEVAKCVASNDTKYGLIAYYNYLEGLVQASLDETYKNDLKIVGMYSLPIVLCAGVYGAKNVVYSHEKALGQCSEWIQSKALAPVPVSSTAEGIKRAEQEGAVGIGRADCVSGTVHEDIGNRVSGRVNHTDFLLLAKTNGVICLPEIDYLSMIAITPLEPDRPGVLAEIMSTFAKRNVNCVKIHSRPALDADIPSLIDPQMFYVEVQAHKEEERLSDCMNELIKKERIRVFGSYASHLVSAITPLNMR